MPDIKKYKSVAVPIPTWEKLQKISGKNNRSPAQQISFLVDLAEDAPGDKDMVSLYHHIKGEHYS